MLHETSRYNILLPCYFPFHSSKFLFVVYSGFGSNPSTTTAPSGLFSSSFGSSTTGTTGGSLFGGSSGGIDVF